jgi:hypothetical protein
MSSAEHIIIEAGDSGKAEARAKVMAEIRAASHSLSCSDSVVQGVNKILEVYQEKECTFVRMLSLDAKRILVLAEYHGNNRSVLDPYGPLLPQGQFAIMISSRWRQKSRVKNDPAFRNSAHTLQMCNRTKHLPASCVATIQAIKLFKYGACMGLISTDRPLKKSSLVLGFTSIPYAEKGATGLWDHVRTQTATYDEGILSDGIRQVVRELEFAIRVLNEKGLAMGPGAIDRAQIRADGKICFPDLSQAAVFPETNNQYAQQFQNATNYIARQNTSCSWKPDNPKDSTCELTATFLCDTNVLEVLRNERQSGGEFALVTSDESVLENAPRGKGKKASKGILKENAFQRDQQSVARNLACVLRFPTVAPTTAESISFTRAVSSIVNSKGRAHSPAQTFRRMVNLFAAGSSSPGQSILDRHWKHCVDWLVRCMRKPGLGDSAKLAANYHFLANSAEEHLFLTAYIPHPSLASQISGNGVRLEDSVFTLPPGWTLVSKSSKCSFFNETLAASVLKLESEKKGTGLFAGRRIGKKELVSVYIGEYVRDPAARPLSRMVVHHTSSVGSEEWAYCFGIEDLSRCIAIRALGPSANAPSQGETSNCSLHRDQWAMLQDEKGKAMIAFPIGSDRELANGEPVLWDYVPEAASGRNFANLE